MFQIFIQAFMGRADTELLKHHVQVERQGYGLTGDQIVYLFGAQRLTIVGGVAANHFP
ncbi:hypothetical protein D3C84_861720 [compost metagenome]